MLELWTEDSGAGYKFIKIFNNTVFQKLFTVVKHSGIGERLPSSKIEHGGVLYHLKHETFDKNKIVLLLIDKAIDQQETKENYVMIEETIQKRHLHNNVYIIDQHCFETCMLSYQNKNRIIGSKDIKLLRIADEFVTLCTNQKYSYLNMSPDLRAYISNKEQTNSEHISKEILGGLTSVTLQSSNRNEASMKAAIISGKDIGVCWCKDCCTIAANYIRKCNISHSVTLDNKMNDIKLHSIYGDIVKQIYSILEPYFKQRYRAGNTANITKETYYRQQVYTKLKIRSVADIVLLAKYIDKYLDKTQSMYWSFERLYRFYKCK